MKQGTQMPGLRHAPIFHNWLRVSIGIGATLLNDGQNGYGEACDAMM
jgi:hypothetical protein